MKALKLLLLLVMTRALADTGYEGAPACADAIDLTKVEHRLMVRDHDAILETFGLYQTRCDGGLYLVDLQHHRKMWRVNESWWLEKIESMAWVDPAAANGIEVIATYITGIGPTGVQPFRARVVMRRGGGGPGGYTWTPGEPEFIEDAAPPTRKLDPRPQPAKPGPGETPSACHPVVRATSFEEFAALGLRSRNAPWRHDAINEATFAAFDFYAISVFHSSGSQRIEAVDVYEDDGRYTVRYDIYRPRIGTADIQFSTVWALLPKDAVDVVIAEDARRAGLHRDDVTSGSISRGGLNPRRFGSTFCLERRRDPVGLSDQD